MTKLTPVRDIPAYAVIIRAIHERGATQAEALAELDRRMLWLTDEQKEQAGLACAWTAGREHIECLMDYAREMNRRGDHVTVGRVLAELGELLLPSTIPGRASALRAFRAELDTECPWPRLAQC